MLPAPIRNFRLRRALLNHADSIEPLFARRRFQLLRHAQDGGNGNCLFVLAMVVAADGGSHRDIEKTAEHVESAGLRLADVGRARGPRGIGVIHDEGTPRQQTFAHQCQLPLRRTLYVAAHVRMRPCEVLIEICRFAGALQTDEDYGFRHRSNLGGRVPRRTAPATGT